MKSKCPKCNAKDKTESTALPEDSKWGFEEVTKCDECGLWRSVLVPRNEHHYIEGSQPWSSYQKKELEANAKDVLQPIKSGGRINKHFVQAHGTKSIEKNYKMTREQVLKKME